MRTARGKGSAAQDKTRDADPRVSSKDTPPVLSACSIARTRRSTDVDATTFAYTDLSASSRHSSPFLFTQNSPLRALGETFAGHARRSDRVEGWRPGGLRFDFEWLIHYSCGNRCAHTVSAYSLSVAKDFETSSSAN